MSLNLHFRPVTAVLLAWSLAAACADRPGAPDGELVGPTLAQGGPPGSRGTPVSAEFRDDLDDAVFSDEFGPYQAIIMTNGNFKLDVRDAERALCTDTPWTESFCTGRAYITTSSASVAGGFAGMKVGSHMTTNLLTYWVGDDGYQYFLRYGKACDLAVAEDHRALVEHIDASTWLVSGTTGILCRAPARGRFVVEELPSDNLPFLITVTLP